VSVTTTEKTNKAKIEQKKNEAIIKRIKKNKNCKGTYLWC